MKTLLIACALATATCWGGTAAELELKLQDSYNQRATNDDRKGLRLTAAAERNCADLHADAAEMILKSPSKAVKLSAAAHKSCEEMTSEASEQEAEMARQALKQSQVRLCLALYDSRDGAPAGDPGLYGTCKELGIILKTADHPGFDCNVTETVKFAEIERLGEYGPTAMSAPAWTGTSARWMPVDLRAGRRLSPWPTKRKRSSGTFIIASANEPRHAC